MASFNKVILIGNLVADPELKKTPSGIPVTTFRIAVGRRFAKEGDPVQADFFDIVCWRNQAEFVTRYFNKGKPILVCGVLQSRNWVDQNNQKRYSVEVVAEEISFVERKGYDGQTKSEGTYYGGDSSVGGSSSQPEANFEEVSTEDDLPF
jgi:single stranded DNA-binding protein (ssb)